MTGVLTGAGRNALRLALRLHHRLGRLLRLFGGQPLRFRGLICGQLFDVLLLALEQIGGLVAEALQRRCNDRTRNTLVNLGLRNVQVQLN